MAKAPSKKDQRKKLPVSLYKEIHLKRTRRWREENKERLNEQLTCGCGGELKYRNKAEHKRGKKHIAWVALGDE